MLRLVLSLRKIAWLAAVGALAACGGAEPGVAGGQPDTAYRSDAGDDPAYAGEWASAETACQTKGELWTIEARRLGMKRQRFCVFDRVFTSSSPAGAGWSASARCLFEGRESHDFLFFRLTPSRMQMRVTINDAAPIDLVRCPMRT